MEGIRKKTFLQSSWFHLLGFVFTLITLFILQVNTITAITNLCGFLCFTKYVLYRLQVPMVRVADIEAYVFPWQSRAAAQARLQTL